MLTQDERRVLEHLSQFITEHKKNLIEQVLDFRTRYVTVVLEDIFQSQNASAVIRTCECMGLQDIHIAENITRYSINPRVHKGANKWISIHKHAARNQNNTLACFNELRSRGYRIIALDPSPDGCSIFDLNVSDGPLALAFGNELRGLSAQALNNADARLRIPMYGFTESLNISVSVAICLNTVIMRMRESAFFYGLNPTEREMLRLTWYRKIVRNSTVIEREFLRANE